MTYLRYEIGSGQVTKVTADEILGWFEACHQRGDVWQRMNDKNFFFGSLERVYANRKSVKELGLTYFTGGRLVKCSSQESGRVSDADERSV